MPVHDDLGNRMKSYEQVSKTKLMRRSPVMIRIDGKAFHTFTKGFQRPFDEALVSAMQKTTKYLCENIQNCVLGYTQSDEISLMLIDYARLETAAWFDYEVQKMCSITASMATMAFNKFFAEQAATDAHKKAMEKGAMFDARVFNLPKEEVTNCFYWRQLDATRNSIQMVGQANFSYKELQNKSCNNIQDMLMEQKGINWNNYPTHLKRGSCVIKEKCFPDEFVSKDTDNSAEYQTCWVIDKEIPIFRGEGREYIERLIYVGE